MDRLPCIENRAFKIGPGTLAQIELADSFRTEFEELEPEPILACVRVFLNQAMTLKHHNQSMRSALVELEHRGDLHQSEIWSLMRENFEQRQCSVDYLNLVWRSGITLCLSM